VSQGRCPWLSQGAALRLLSRRSIPGLPWSVFAAKSTPSPRSRTARMRRSPWRPSPARGEG